MYQWIIGQFLNQVAKCLGHPSNCRCIVEKQNLEICNSLRVNPRQALQLSWLFGFEYIFCLTGIIAPVHHGNPY